MTTVPARADVPIESTWNHESVFPSFDAWREEYQAAVSAIAEITPYQGTLAQSPERLAEVVRLAMPGHRPPRLDALYVSSHVAGLRRQQ